MKKRKKQFCPGRVASFCVFLGAYMVGDCELSEHDCIDAKKHFERRSSLREPQQLSESPIGIRTTQLQLPWGLQTGGSRLFRWELDDSTSRRSGETLDWLFRAASSKVAYDSNKVACVKRADAQVFITKSEKAFFASSQPESAQGGGACELSAREV